MGKLYERVNWEDKPSTKTPISAENLNEMDKGISNLDDKLVEQEAQLESLASQVEEIANNQIPEEYLKASVDAYIDEKGAGLATDEDLVAIDTKIDEVNNQLSSEIVELKKNVFTNLTDYNDNFAESGASAANIVLVEKIKANTTICEVYVPFGYEKTFPVFIFDANTGVILDEFTANANEILDIYKTYDVDVYIGGFNGCKYAISSDTSMGNVYEFWQMSITDNVVSIEKTPTIKMIYKVRVTIDRINGIENELKEIKATTPTIVANKSVIKVAKDGSGNFTTINDALTYSDIYANRENEVTILVYPGTYNEVVNVNGNRFVSIVGVNKETCIIRDDTGLYTNCPLRIAGNSYVANLTLISTHKNDENFVVDSVLQRNPSYALHIDDRHADNNEDYVCEVFNCKIYSEQNPAVGIGLDKNQAVKLINCEIISNFSEDMLNLSGVKEGVWSNRLNGGALFYHALYSGNYTDDNGYQKLIVKDCIIINNSDNAVLGEAGGMEEQVELTFINNVGMARNGATFVKGLSRATISPLSYGNNMLAMNYTE